MTTYHKYTRLRGYDYSIGGAYFITINTLGRSHLFGRVVDPSDPYMELNDHGRIVQQCWDSIPKHFINVHLDAFQIMPDHLHGIVVIAELGGSNAANGPNAAKGSRHASTLQGDGRPCGVRPRSLGSIVGSFKSAATKRINELRGSHGSPLWQHNYHDRVIRNAQEHARIAKYISENPAKWANDMKHR
ncbi:MAG: hypothetical protein KBA60_07225 [Flavobacteriales bacterium]|nr:transposase [Flavobacteriales bacterium]MBP7155783.1 hypothetical protein [Flavobacteriales bacterium]